MSQLYCDNCVIINENIVTFCENSGLTFHKISLQKTMKKVTIYYKSIYRNPGWLSCSTCRNFDPFYQGKRSFDSITEFSQNYSIQSYEVSRKRYLIGKMNEQKTKPRVFKTTIFFN